jgi:hypothetical protein
VPPLAVSVAEYELLVCLLGSEVVVICTGVTPAATVILRFAVAFCAGELESVASIANEDVPAVVGVPLIWPELLSASPAGREPETKDQL